MKLAIAALIATLGMTTTAHAAPCQPTLAQVATVLANSIDELAFLRTQLQTFSHGVTCETIDKAKTRFLFTFNTCGNCLPRKAVLDVVEDLEPTYRDGHAIYTKTLR